MAPGDESQAGDGVVQGEAASVAAADDGKRSFSVPSTSFRLRTSSAVSQFGGVVGGAAAFGMGEVCCSRSVPYKVDRKELISATLVNGAAVRGDQNGAEAVGRVAVGRVTVVRAAMSRAVDLEPQLTTCCRQCRGSDSTGVGEVLSVVCVDALPLPLFSTTLITSISFDCGSHRT